MASQEIAWIGKASTPAVLLPDRPSQIFGSVGFVGDASGLIYLCFTEAFAKDLTGRILGMSPAEVEMNGSEVVTDAIGEVTNMTVGGFKNTLCDLGHACKLTLPTIVRGQHLSVAAIKSATRHVFHFESAGHRLVADIQIKLE
jgi:chemotaxis protein CheX